MSETLSRITTQWSEMEFLIDQEGPAALANYLAAKYYSVLARKFKKYAPQIDELRSHELASDAIYEFIKNDYNGIKKLDRNRGHLRGLFFKIIRSRLYHSRVKYRTQEDFSYESDDGADFCVDVYLDFHEALEKLATARPRLHTPFKYHYLEGKSLKEIAVILDIQANAVKQRLYAARRWLAEELKSYQEE